MTLTDRITGMRLLAAGYRNPMRGVRGLTPERVDMGVDYAGSGPVYAVGPGVVALAATGPGSPWYGALGAPVPGTWIAYQLTRGPYAGQYVYLAEDVTPAVRTGQRVTAATVVGILAGGCETGWASRPGTTGVTLAAANNQQAAHGDPGAFSTAYGVAFNDLLKALGAPGGQINPPVSGTVPPGFGVAAGGPVPATVTGAAGPGAGGLAVVLRLAILMGLAAGALVAAGLAAVALIGAVRGAAGGTVRAGRPL